MHFTKQNAFPGETYDLPGGYSIKLESEPDQSHGAPWEEADCHGEVSNITTRTKRAGELLLSSPSRFSYRYYDFSRTIRRARREGWGLGSEELQKLSRELGRKPTRREIVARAVLNDYECIRGWCIDDWSFMVCTVTIYGPDGEELESDSLGGVYGYRDGDRETLAEMANPLAEKWSKEEEEREFWEARDTVTA